MSLTNKEIATLIRLPAKTKLEIMHVCAGDLALVTVDEYSTIMGEKKRTVYKAAKDGHKVKFELCNHIFLAVNDK